MLYCLVTFLADTHIWFFLKLNCPKSVWHALRPVQLHLSVSSGVCPALSPGWVHPFKWSLLKPSVCGAPWMKIRLPSVSVSAGVKSGSSRSSQWALCYWVTPQLLFLAGRLAGDQIEDLAHVLQALSTLDWSFSPEVGGRRKRNCRASLRPTPD